MCVRIAKLWSGNAGQACTGKDTTRRDRRVRHRGERHKTARTYVCVYVRMRVLFSALSFKAPVCCSARPDISPALATMTPKLVKKGGLKAASATSFQSSPQKSTSRVDLRTLTASKTALGSPGRRNAKPATAQINFYVRFYKISYDFI